MSQLAARRVTAGTEGTHSYRHLHQCREVWRKETRNFLPARHKSRVELRTAQRLTFCASLLMLGTNPIHSLLHYFSISSLLLRFRF